MKKLNYEIDQHTKAVVLQRKVIGVFAELTREFLEMELADLPFQGIFKLRASITPDKLEAFHQKHVGAIEDIASMMEKEATVETLSQIIEKVNIHAYRLEGHSLVQLDYSKQVGRWWNLLTQNSRGNIFRYDTMELISLPFQKFYNVNERNTTMLDALNLNQAHYAMEKLDGTMIHLFELDGKLYSATRGAVGVYYFNDKAMTFIKQANHEVILEAIQSGYTPIFEILLKEGDEFGQTVRYEHDDLRLIAVRHRETGAYVHPDELARIAEAFGVKSAQFFNGKELFHLLQERASVQNMEGWVVYFEDGTMVKVKGDAYMGELETKSLVSNTTGKIGEPEDILGETLYGWIQENILDDRLSFIQSPELRMEMEEKAEGIENALSDYLAEMKHLFNRHYTEDRKSFALALQADATIDRSMFGMLFELYKGAPIEAKKVKWETVKKYLPKTEAALSA